MSRPLGLVDLALLTDTIGVEVRKSRPFSSELPTRGPPSAQKACLGGQVPRAPSLADPWALELKLKWNPPEKDAPSCSQGDLLPESTVSRTEQATPRSSAPHEPSRGQNEGLGSPVPQGRNARAGSLCPRPGGARGPGGMRGRLWAGVALEPANWEGRLRLRGGRPAAQRPGKCALVLCQIPQPALNPLAPCPQALAAVLRRESFRTRTLAQQPQRVTRIFRLPLEGPDWTGNKATQTCPLPPPSCLRRGIKAAGDVCARALPPRDASLQIPPAPRSLPPAPRAPRAAGLLPCTVHPDLESRGARGPALLGDGGLLRRQLLSLSLSLRSPSGCVQTTCGGCVSVRTACLCVRDRQQDPGSSRPG